MTNGISAAAVLPLAAVSVALFRNGRVLLIQRGQPPAEGLWSLPGGHIEPGEPALEAARRELREETGLAAQLLGVSDAVEVIHRDENSRVTFHRVLLLFYGLWRAGEPRAGSDARAVGWFEPQALSRLPVTEGLAGSVARAWARLQEPAPKA